MTVDDCSVFVGLISGCVEEEKLQELKEKYEKRQKRKGHPLSPFITGKFEYGIYRPAAKRDVHVFLRKAEHAVDLGTPKPVYAGVYTTTSKGQLSVPFPKLCMSSPGNRNQNWRHTQA